MAHQISGHLSNAAILALSAVIAVAANQFTAAPRPVTVGVARAGIPGGDISGFIAPPAVTSMVPPFQLPIQVDPFEPTEPGHETAVASLPGLPTVRTSSTGGRILSAILVADDRRVAVIDDAAVGVGDLLPDGARVSAIQPNRVFVVDSKGRWQTLTLTNRGQ